MTTTLDQALQQLVDEGDVRISLYVRGITGIPGNKTCCPIARYLLAETGKQYEVGLEFVTDAPLGRTWWLPIVVEEFIEDFDTDCFPELSELEDSE